MLIPNWYAIFYPISVILFLIMLAIAIIKHEKYTIFFTEVSDLGKKGYRNKWIFNRFISFYAAIHAPWIYFLYQFLIKNSALNIFALVGLFGMCLLCIGGVITGFVTNDKKIHSLIAKITFGGYVLGEIFLVYPFILSGFPWWVLIFSFLGFAAGLFTFVAYLSKKSKRIIFFGEWMVFISMILWLFSVYLVLLFA